MSGREEEIPDRGRSSFPALVRGRKKERRKLSARNFSALTLHSARYTVCVSRWNKTNSREGEKRERNSRNNEHSRAPTAVSRRKRKYLRNVTNGTRTTMGAFWAKVYHPRSEIPFHSAALARLHSPPIPSPFLPSTPALLYSYIFFVCSPYIRVMSARKSEIFFATLQSFGGGQVRRDFYLELLTVKSSCFLYIRPPCDARVRSFFSLGAFWMI